MSLTSFLASHNLPSELICNGLITSISANFLLSFKKKKKRKKKKSKFFSFVCHSDRQPTVSFKSTAHVHSRAQMWLPPTCICCWSPRSAHTGCGRAWECWWWTSAVGRPLSASQRPPPPGWRPQSAQHSPDTEVTTTQQGRQTGFMVMGLHVEGFVETASSSTMILQFLPHPHPPKKTTTTTTAKTTTIQQQFIYTSNCDIMDRP